MKERRMPCPGCADGTLLDTWPMRGNSPYRPSPEPSITVQACRVCAGVWVDRETLGALIDEAARFAARTHPTAIHRKTMAPGLATGPVQYRHCPVCKQSMLRKNFGTVSGIVVDVCAHHGTFFEYGELPDVVAFVRSGGLALTERHASAESQRSERHRASRAAVPSPNMGPMWMGAGQPDPVSDELLQRVAVFLRNMFR